VVHYYVRFCGPNLPSKLEQSEVTETNFDLFNMVTLFVSEAEYGHLLSLVADTSAEDFADLCARAGITARYLYYVSPLADCRM
jgi:hypothetical protein